MVGRVLEGSVGRQREMDAECNPGCGGKMDGQGRLAEVESVR